MLVHVASSNQTNTKEIIQHLRTVKGASDVVVIVYVDGTEESPKQSSAVASIVGEIRRHIDQTQSAQGPLSVANLFLDRGRHEVKCGGELIHLSPAEFSLLEHLLVHRDRVQSEVELMECVCGGMEYGKRFNTLWVHIYRLRKKLHRYGLGNLIQTIRGVGYILKTPLAA